MEMGVVSKNMTMCLCILYLTEINSNIWNNVSKVVDDNIGPIIQFVAHKSINKNTEDEVFLAMDYDVDLWEKLTED